MAVVTSTANAAKKFIILTFAAKDVFAFGAASFLIDAAITYFVVAFRPFRATKCNIPACQTTIHLTSLAKLNC